jgi:hypothetical protein
MIEEELKVVCWKWKPPVGYRSKFGAEQVNNLFNMVGRNYHKPFEMVCVTDDATDISSEVRIIPLKEIEEFQHLPSPHGGVNPACYRRLFMYSDAARQYIGERFVSVDLDVVIVDDVTPVWDVPEDFRIWGETLRRTPYNGSMQLLRAGTRTQVYDDFDPDNSPRDARKAGFDGSDQAWISYKLGPLEKRWTVHDGVYSFRLHVKPQSGKMPKGARIIFFEGQVDPWTPFAMKLCPWIKNHWR